MHLLIVNDIVIWHTLAHVTVINTVGPMIAFLAKVMFLVALVCLFVCKQHY